MCKTGTVFDIKEFAVYDGPGIRTTVFMKGCPLRCQWCHNPEGLSPRPQLIVSVSACIHCGACEKVCTHKDGCVACGACVPACRQGLRRIAGTAWRSDALAQRLMRQQSLLSAAGGGVTFSGGEPLLQWDFVRDVARLMPGMHTCIETSGYATDAVFADAMDTLQMIIMDIKLVDSAAHVRWTGRDNACILKHLEMLKAGSTPFIIRLPVIPGVNDNDQYFEAAAALLQNAPALERVEILPYHPTAGAKYEMVGRDYHVDFSPEKRVYINQEPFARYGYPVLVHQLPGQRETDA